MHFKSYLACQHILPVIRRVIFERWKQCELFHYHSTFHFHTLFPTFGTDNRIKPFIYPLIATVTHSTLGRTYGSPSSFPFMDQINRSVAMTTTHPILNWPSTILAASIVAADPPLILTIILRCSCFFFCEICFTVNCKNGLLPLPCAISEWMREIKGATWGKLQRSA